MPDRDALEILDAATKAVHPAILLPEHIRFKDGNLWLGGQKIKTAEIKRLLVIAAGKAAPAMAKSVETRAGKLISSGICITKYGHSIPLSSFQIIEAGHPVPDANSIRAGELVAETLQHLAAEDIVLLLLSGGASSLLADVPAGCTTEEMQQLSEMLINSGADIREINTVRKHVSRIKGGQLAKAAFPAKLFTLIISDVVGDDTGTIASGPTVPDKSTFEEAFAILVKYNIWDRTANGIRQYISRGLDKEIEETPKPGSVFFSNTFTTIIGNNKMALEAAKLKAEQLGYHTAILTDKLTGDTEQVSRLFVSYLREYQGRVPFCALMGGEPTLKVTGDGKGGRNQHFVLCAMHEFLNDGITAGARDITILSAGTDGTDGPTDAAGAVFNSRQLAEKPLLNDKVESSLKRFDAYNYFTDNGGLVITRPTQTNVMDIIVGLVI